MAIACVAGFIEALGRYQLLEEPQRQELTGELRRQFPEPRELARELVRRGWLTPFQVNQLFLGRATELLLGPYLLIERLGEGGMGEVFKARHRNLGRTVALKVIRKECLDNPNALPRFQREIQAASQLSHPNVVRALDADHVEGTYYFAMEFVDGIDLARLVKQSGPLPILQACDYVRQAALGLQHAHERGLIHRDIKPANLLVARLDPSLRQSGSSAHLLRPCASAYRWGLIKILDMGLARLLDRGAQQVHTSLTQAGTVMGTPDYIAPEQARNAHTSDIRADLYSLGCTFYYLLCGQVPFPNGTVIEKLLAHQMDDPEPVHTLRRARLLESTPAPAAREARALAEVPPEVAAVVQTLMSKAPENRYQTPAELAAVLADLAAQLESSRPPRARLKPTDKTLTEKALAHRAGTPTLSRAVPPGCADDTEPLTPRRAPATQRQPRPPALKRRWLSGPTRGKLVCGGLLLLIVLSGRLLQQGAQGSLTAAMQPSSDPAAIAWDRLVHRAKQPGVSDDAVRRDLLAFRVQHAGTPQCRRAAEMLARLPSSLDALKASAIPKKERLGWFPPDLVAVLGQRRPGGEMPALCVAFSPDGKQLARGGADALVRRWEVPALREAPPLKGPKGRVRALAWSPDGRTLASATLDGMVVLWDAATGAAVKTLQQGEPPGLCLVFSPDGKRLASGNWGGLVRLWDVRTGTQQCALGPAGECRVLSVAWSPDGRTLACGQDDHLLRLWDVASATPRPLATYDGHTNWVTVVAFSPDGQTVVSGGGGDGELRVCTWDGTTFKDGKVLRGHSNIVHAAAFAPDGRTLASAGQDHSVCVWDMATGTAVRRWDNLRAPIHGVAFAPDGRHVATASASGTVYVLRISH